MTRGTTLDGFLDRDERGDAGHDGMHSNMEIVERWHAFVEQECTKRYPS
jgi:hypothetical protein